MLERFAFFLMFALTGSAVLVPIRDARANDWKPLPSHRSSQAKQKTSVTPRPETTSGHPTKEDVNAGVVGIIGGRLASGTMTVATVEIAELFQDEKGPARLRVVPMIGRGRMQNVWDLLHLPAADFAFVQTDILEYLKDDPAAAEITDKIRYVAPMFPEEVHIIARPEIRSIGDLAGKRISFDGRGTGSSVSGPLIFRRLGLEVIAENVEFGVALERMRRGDLAAVMTVLGKPSPSVNDIRSDDGFHLLAIPYAPNVLDLYFPATFKHGDYPNLIPPGRSVDTIAVGNVLAAFDWPEGSERHARATRFVAALFAGFPRLQGSGCHPKWKEVNLAASIPGWRRFKPAEDWLARRRIASRSRVGEKVLRADFKAFIRKQKATGVALGSMGGQSEIFKRFLDWRRQRD